MKGIRNEFYHVFGCVGTKLLEIDAPAAIVDLVKSKKAQHSKNKGSVITTKNNSNQNNKTNLKKTKPENT